MSDVLVEYLNNQNIELVKSHLQIFTQQRLDQIKALREKVFDKRAKDDREISTRETSEFLDDSLSWAEEEQKKEVENKTPGKCS